MLYFTSELNDLSLTCRTTFIKASLPHTVWSIECSHHNVNWSVAADWWSGARLSLSRLLLYMLLRSWGSQVDICKFSDLNIQLICSEERWLCGQQVTHFLAGHGLQTSKLEISMALRSSNRIHYWFWACVLDHILVSDVQVYTQAAESWLIKVLTEAAPRQARHTTWVGLGLRTVCKWEVSWDKRCSYGRNHNHTQIEPYK